MFKALLILELIFSPLRQLWKRYMHRLRWRKVICQDRSFVCNSRQPWVTKIISRVLWIELSFGNDFEKALYKKTSELKQYFSGMSKNQNFDETLVYLATAKNEVFDFPSSKTGELQFGINFTQCRHIYTKDIAFCQFRYICIYIYISIYIFNV